MEIERSVGFHVHCSPFIHILVLHPDKTPRISETGFPVMEVVLIFPTGHVSNDLFIIDSASPQG